MYSHTAERAQDRKISPGTNQIAAFAGFRPLVLIIAANTCHTANADER